MEQQTQSTSTVLPTVKELRKIGQKVQDLQQIMRDHGGRGHGQKTPLVFNLGAEDQKERLSNHVRIFILDGFADGVRHNCASIRDFIRQKHPDYTIVLEDGDITSIINELNPMFK